MAAAFIDFWTNLGYCACCEFGGECRKIPFVYSVIETWLSLQECVQSGMSREISWELAGLYSQKIV